MALPAPPAIKLQSTTTVGTKSGVKFLVFGPPGAGKTRLCATMPNPVILSAEAGLLSLRKINLPFIEIKNVADFINAWRWVSSSAEARQFQSICIDSISEIAENELSQAKSSVKDVRQAYGTMQEEVERTVKNFRNLQGPHVYFTAKQATIKAGDGNLIAGLQMPGNNLPNSIPFIFDEVFQLVPGRTPEGKSYSSLKTKGISEWDIIKDRSGSLDEWEGPVERSDIPNLGVLINKIMKG